ncbi:rho-related GTP-binding protein RhoN-like [Amphiura filiformis]|uniref:rho-related GTP-binding protein RhoN-like n=1 Tax=Amphiura filiformis TaxID=82378 RepID=UPI003B211C45
MKEGKMFRQHSMMVLTEPISCKVVVVGDSKCGKSALINAFLGKGYGETYTPTMFESYSSTLEVDKYRIDITVWDTSGKPEYASVRPLAYADISAAVICFDIGQPDSIANVTQKWHLEIKKYCPNCPIVLVGCKMDLRNDIGIIHFSEGKKVPVSHDKGSKVASQIRAAAYVECSSRTNNASVQEVFEIASLAAIGKLNLQKSYIDLPSAVKKFPLQQSFRRKKRSTSASVLRPVRVKATVVERESRGCVVM